MTALPSFGEVSGWYVEQERDEALAEVKKLEKNCDRLLAHMGWKNNCIQCAEGYPFAYPCSAHDEMFQRLLRALTAEALIAELRATLYPNLGPGFWERDALATTPVEGDE